MGLLVDFDAWSLCAGILLGLLATLGLLGVISGRWRREGRVRAEALASEAREEAARMAREGQLALREAEFERKQAWEMEAARLREAALTLQRQVESRAESLERRIEQADQRESDLEARREECNARREEMDRSLAQQREALHRIGALGAEEARTLLLTRLEQELSQEIGRRIICQEAAASEGLAERARQVLALAIQRYAAGHTAESTVSVVDLPGEEMKGRIIGREGRNIRTFEKATGVDLVVDDTPGVVLLSSFDPVRREIARLALEKLILDGRIHPTRIEELVEEARSEIAALIVKSGIEAAREANVEGLDRRLVEQLGRLKYRTSYSQNVLRHSIEVAHLTGVMAAEIGLDGSLGRRCGLLHDVGKALDHELEGPHTVLGADLSRRCGEAAEVVDAALRHHDDLRIGGMVYTVLVAAADAISASRPGARRDTLEKYVRRLTDLEALACGFPGVEQAYALQAGREVRIIADSLAVDDEGAAKLCRDLARAIQQELHFPGEVKVTVVRETRAVEFAR